MEVNTTLTERQPESVAASMTGGKRMSARELCVKLMENVPDYKIGYLLAYLQGLVADEPEDDAYCRQLLAAYEADPEKEQTFPLEQCKQEWGIS